MGTALRMADQSFCDGDCSSPPPQDRNGGGGVATTLSQGFCSSSQAKSSPGKGGGLQ